MQRRLIRLTLALACGVSCQGPAAAADAAVPALLERARLWESNRRDDLARGALNKLFLIAPDHPDGLALLGPLQLRAGQAEAARATLERLRQLQSDHPGIARIEALLRLKDGDQGKLKQARQLARSGQTRAALAAWRALYPNGVPDGDLAMEYWQLLARADNGWEPARAGLARLVREHPENRRYRLALAAHLTARQPANREALKVIIELSRHALYGKEAKDAWRRAMLGLEQTAGSIALLREYLAQDRHDSAVRERLDGALRTAEAQRKLLADPAWRARLDGLALLKGDRIEAAEDRLLQSLAARPDDAEVVGAMGLVRLRQGHHAEAEAYFLQAQQLARGERDKWAGLARTARYWGLLRQSGDARESGELALAEQKLLEARALDPREPNAALGLANVYVEQKRIAQAEQAYREALRLAPNDVNAIGGLATLYLRNARERDAETLIAGLTPAQRREVANTLNGVRAAMLRDRADDLQSRAQTDDAIVVLERAVEIDINDPWVRYDLARLYLVKGEGEKAQALFDTLMEQRPHDPAALYAMALFQAGRDQEFQALASLERVADGDRNAGMSRLQRRLWTGVQARRAVALARLGQAAQAHQVLAGAEAAVGNDRDLALDIAAAWIDLGNAAQASALLQRFAGDSPPVGWRLRRAQLLARSGADDGLPGLLDGIEASAPLAREDLDTLKELRLSLALRRAAALRRQGSLDQARQALRPGLSAYPGDTRLLAAEAGILRDLGLSDAAQDNYRRILLLQPEDGDASLALIASLIEGGHAAEARERIEQELERKHARPLPANPDFMVSLAGALIDLNDDAQARQLVDEVLVHTPGHPRALAYAGQLARRDGRIDQAVDFLQRSLAGEMAQRFPAAVPALSSLYRAPDDAGRPLLQVVPAAPEAIAAAQGSGAAYRDLGEMLDRQTGWISSAIDWRTRPGTDGKSQLDVKEMPIEWKRPWDGGSQLALRTDVVQISAGTLDGANTDEAGTFGSLLLCQPFCAGGALRQSAAGVALSAGWQRPGLSMDLGTTPLGFPVRSLVGGILRKGDLGPFSYSVDISRRPLTGGLLSYAGARDPNTGRVWGGVRASGVRFGLSRDDGGSVGAWATLGLHKLTGKNVQDNIRTQLMSGGYWRAINEDDRLLSLGLTAMHWRFSENAGEFTFGHGGYFSPQRFSSLSLPLTFGQRHARFSYSVRGALSVSRSQTSAAPYFPTSIALQAEAEALASAGGVDPHYSGGHGRGVGRSFSGVWEYQADPKLFVGGRLAIDRSDDYSPNSILLYLRYAIGRAAAQPVFLPPDPLAPSSQR